MAGLDCSTGIPPHKSPGIFFLGSTDMDGLRTKSLAGNDPRAIELRSSSILIMLGMQLPNCCLVSRKFLKKVLPKSPVCNNFSKKISLTQGI